MMDTETGGIRIETEKMVSQQFNTPDGICGNLCVSAGWMDFADGAGAE